MAAMSHAARTRVICKVFIKAGPQAVWDAICPAVKKHGGCARPTRSGDGLPAAPRGEDGASARCLCDLITIGEVLEADPPGRLISAPAAAGPNARIRSALLSFELRDTLAGYTAVTVSCEPDRAPGAQQSGAGCAHGWDQLLADLKAGIEADRRESHRTTLTRSSPRLPLQLRPKPVPEVVALSGERLSPGRPARASPGGPVRVSRCRFAPVPGEGERRAVPGGRGRLAAPGQHGRLAAPGQRITATG
jgi:hypothetical protein